MYVIISNLPWKGLEKHILIKEKRMQIYFINI